MLCKSLLSLFSLPSLCINMNPRLVRWTLEKEWRKKSSKKTWTQFFVVCGQLAWTKIKHGSWKNRSSNNEKQRNCKGNQSLEWRQRRRKINSTFHTAEVKVCVFIKLIWEWERHATQLEKKLAFVYCSSTLSILTPKKRKKKTKHAFRKSLNNHIKLVAAFGLQKEFCDESENEFFKVVCKPTMRHSSTRKKRNDSKHWSEMIPNIEA